MVGYVLLLCRVFVCPDREGGEADGGWDIGTMSGKFHGRRCSSRRWKTGQRSEKLLNEAML
jgi:hypothetical protein